MSPPEHAYQSQLAYHRNQQYGFQGYTNPRNTQPHFFPQQSSQPQGFPQHSSQPQFKIPQAQEPRKPKRKQKRTGKQPVIELDEGDENEADLIETVKTVYLERVGKKFQYPHVWKILKKYPKWDAAEPIDGDNLQEVFGADKRECPASKQRAVKKQKSVETSGSTKGSQLSSLVSQDYRCKCDAAERAYEAQREKDLAVKKCEEMKFLMIDTSNLPPHKRAFIERQQAEIMKKYEDARADD
ncbi:hypothetical protein Tco_0535589 [Tanacetum coccineum]